MKVIGKILFCILFLSSNVGIAQSWLTPGSPDYMGNLRKKDIKKAIEEPSNSSDIITHFTSKTSQGLYAELDDFNIDTTVASCSPNEQKLITSTLKGLGAELCSKNVTNQIILDTFSNRLNRGTYQICCCSYESVLGDARKALIRLSEKAIRENAFYIDDYNSLSKNEKIKAINTKLEPAKEEGRAIMHAFTMPSVLNGSSIAVSPISSITSDFSNSNFTLRLGSTIKDLFKCEPCKKTDESCVGKLRDNKIDRFNGFATVSAKSSDDLLTIRNNGEYTIDEWKFSLGLNFMLNRGTVHYKTNENKAPNDCVNIWKEKCCLNKCEVYRTRSTWFTLQGHLSNEKRSFIDEGTFIGNPQVKNSVFAPYELMLSFNNYFYSLQSMTFYGLPERFWSHIFSIGAGIRRIDNYSTLSGYDVILNGQSTGLSNNSFSSYGTVTSAKLPSDKYESYEGFFYNMELYYPLILKPSALYIGGRINQIYRSPDESTRNGHIGLLLNVKGKDGKDITNLALLFVYKDWNNIIRNNPAEFPIDDQRKERRSFVLSASIPIIRL